mmetsp:Transcript_30355/g.66452  ORF Transcript_30355/g.66452 Transcript_30355/m.66452 type:complete len:320 (+) Transcript_30355:707-1666(+)
MCQRLITSGSPLRPCACIVASNSTQSPGFTSATAQFRSSLKSKARSGPSRRWNRGGNIRTMTRDLVFRRKISMPSRIERTSPCQLKVRCRYFSKGHERGPFLRELRGPQSDKNSSQLSMEVGPLCTSRGVSSGIVDLRMKTVKMTTKRPHAIMTYFLARTTAQPPNLQVMTSERKVGKLIRDFLATTFRQCGQRCSTSLKAGHSRGSTQKAIQPRLNQMTKPRSHVTHEVSYSMKVMADRPQCGQEQLTGMSPKAIPSFGSSRASLLHSMMEPPALPPFLLLDEGWEGMASSCFLCISGSSCFLCISDNVAELQRLARR